VSNLLWRAASGGPYSLDLITREVLQRIRLWARWRRDGWGSTIKLDKRAKVGQYHGRSQTAGFFARRLWGRNFLAVQGVIL
jgi:hypothetical protein